jgi:Skp family chaperone for outer membrane proteins
MRDQLAAAAELLATELSGLEQAAKPTTYQTYRWLGGAMTSCQAKLVALADAAGVKIWPVADAGMILLQMHLLAADFENRVIQCFNAKGQLDQLPPGEPGEPKFEKDLKALIAVNKAYTELLHELAALSNALSSDTYRLGISEEERAAAWRAARKAKLEQVYEEAKKALAEAREYTEKVQKSVDEVARQLETNDQLTFGEIDGGHAPEMGE